MFTIKNFAPALVTLWAATAGWAHEEPTTDTITKPVIEALSKTTLAGVEGTEVIVSRVALPPNMTLPLHWHPGEEFIYVIEGSGTLHLDGQPDQPFAAGQTVHVPLGHVHTATSGPEGGVVIVFRVHEVGKPGRVLVE